MTLEFAGASASNRKNSLLKPGIFRFYKLTFRFVAVRKIAGSSGNFFAFEKCLLVIPFSKN
jgi:hypothetical protein